MKIAVRVVAFALFATAAIAGNSTPKISGQTALHSSLLGPIPACIPWTQKCPPIRDK